MSYQYQTGDSVKIKWGTQWCVPSRTNNRVVLTELTSFIKFNFPFVDWQQILYCIVVFWSCKWTFWTPSSNLCGTLRWRDRDGSETSNLSASLQILSILVTLSNDSSLQILSQNLTTISRYAGSILGVTQDAIRVIYKQDSTFDVIKYVQYSC